MLVRKFCKMASFPATQVQSYLSNKTRTLILQGRKLFTQSPDLETELSLQQLANSIVPPLEHDSHKGQCGRIAIIGGSEEYSGAPYFAGITAMRVGCDLAHIFCVKEASPVIKAFSPDLIVYPYLNDTRAADKINNLLTKMHAVVIGPGLGRNPEIFPTIEAVIDKVRELKLPLVLDADAVYLVSLNPGVVKGYKSAILTPNSVEFNRLYHKVMGREATGEDLEQEVVALSKAMGHVTIVRKGHVDVISDSRNVLECRVEGSARRCGGQGDLLSGSIGVFAFWANKTEPTNNNALYQRYGETLTAAYAGCALTRTCNKLAFKKHGRSMLTEDMIKEIHPAFDSLFSS